MGGELACTQRLQLLIFCSTKQVIIQNNTKLHPLSKLLTIQGAGGHNLPYLGYIEVSFSFQNISEGNADYPFLIVPDTSFNRTTPILIGTNILKPVRQDLYEHHGEKFQQKVSIPNSLQVALNTIGVQERHLRRSKGVFGVVKMGSCIAIPGKTSTVVDGFTRLTIPVTSRIAYLQPLSNLPESLEITSGLVGIENGMKNVSFEVHNYSDKPCMLQSGCMVCELHEARIDEPEITPMTRKLFLEQFDLNHLDSDKKEHAENLLWNWSKIFSQGPLDIGCTSKIKHRTDLLDDIPFKE
jgi:hypothetical protein